jgi:hypothetical protein
MIRGFAIAALHVGTPYWVLVLRRIGSAACSFLFLGSFARRDDERRLCSIMRTSWDHEERRRFSKSLLASHAKSRGPAGAQGQRPGEQVAVHAASLHL